MDRRGLQRGFTLLEVIIVISLMAFVYVVAIPQFNLRTGSEAATILGRFASDVRNAYDLAVISNKTYRMVIKLQSGEYWLEEVESGRQIYMGDHLLDRDPTEDEEKDKQELFEQNFQEFVDLSGETYRDPNEEGEIKPESPVVNAKDKLRPPKWSRVDSPEWRGRSFGDNLLIMDVQAEHHQSKIAIQDTDEKSRAFIYFFPAGYAERAVLHIGYRKGDLEVDDTQPPYTIIIDSYTGTANVTSGYEEKDIRDGKDA